MLIKYIILFYFYISYCHSQSLFNKIINSPFTISVIQGIESDGLFKPRDLDFHTLPGRTNELWVINENSASFDPNFGGSTVTYYNAGSNEQWADYRKDSYSGHFMHTASAISFSDNGGFANTLDVQDTSLTMLGKEQWQWLAKKISKSVDYRIIVSSIQILAVGHGWECWNNLPYERQRFIDLLDKSNINHTVLLSGDRHRGGHYQLKTKSNKIISEMTSSSLNVPYSNPEEPGPLRIGGTYSKENYGVIQMYESKDSLSVMLKNIKGEVINSFKL